MKDNIVRGVTTLQKTSDEDLPPAAVFARDARDRMMYGDGDGEEEVYPSEVTDESYDAKPEDILAEKPILTASERRLPVDPFDALFSILRQHGKPETVELKLGTMGLKFRSLATQLRLPVMALMVDSQALSLELDVDADLVLKIKHVAYNARFVASLPFSGNVNLMLFVADPDTNKTPSNDD